MSAHACLSHEIKRIDRIVAPLSIFIIALNEADRIGRTLEAVRGLSDDVVLVDSGSTDGTQEVARAVTSAPLAAAMRRTRSSRSAGDPARGTMKAPPA